MYLESENFIVSSLKFEILKNTLDKSNRVCYYLFVTNL